MEGRRPGSETPSTMPSEDERPPHGPRLSCRNARDARRAADGPEEDASRMEPDDRDGGRPLESDAATESVLVVDDDPFIARLLEIELKAAGYEVRVAGDGEEALGVANERTPDLVLADVMMPKMDGFELTRRLRQDPRTASVSIIMLTARGLRRHHLRRSRRWRRLHRDHVDGAGRRGRGAGDRLVRRGGAGALRPRGCAARLHRGQEPARRAPAVPGAHHLPRHRDDGETEVPALRGGRRDRHRDEVLHEGNARVLLGDGPPDLLARPAGSRYAISARTS